jgi:hypothetical protein
MRGLLSVWCERWSNCAGTSAAPFEAEVPRSKSEAGWQDLFVDGEGWGGRKGSTELVIQSTSDKGELSDVVQAGTFSKASVPPTNPAPPPRCA